LLVDDSVPRGVGGRVFKAASDVSGVAGQARCPGNLSIRRDLPKWNLLYGSQNYLGFLIGLVILGVEARRLFDGEPADKLQCCRHF